MIPAIVLDPKPGEHILDLTAAPGSKTTQIASLMHNKGSIVANDISNNRIYKLKANLQKYGVTNTQIKHKAAERLWQDHYEEFDKVLLDAPCSMESIFIEQELETYEDWSVKKIKHLAHKQQWMLRSAISACKAGGVIIYSTCTISPQENEQVIDWILQKDGNKIQLEEISIPHLDLMNGITSFEGKSYNPEVAKTKRVIPSEHMEAFFTAKLRKLAVIPGKLQHDLPAGRSGIQSGFRVKPGMTLTQS
jgi:16S rRNA (cytosine1407-C5)-methyltransferase